MPVQPPSPHPRELAADEWMLLFAYRRCDEREKAVIRLFANMLAGQDEVPPADVIILPLRNGKS